MVENGVKFLRHPNVQVRVPCILQTLRLCLMPSTS